MAATHHDSLVVANGFTVSAGGVTVTAGGLTVSAGGAAITGNSTVTGTLSVSGAVTVASGGLTVTAGGLTVTAGGITVTAGDLTMGASSTVEIPATGAINMAAGAELQADGTQASHIADADVAHDVNATFSDTEVEAALDALGGKINAILAVLEGIGATAIS